jgi:hypothetical protein
VLHRKSIHQHKLCWFANLFLNIRILQALREKSTKNIECYFLLILIIFKNFKENIHFFVFICQLRLKVTYNHKYKVYSIFSSILEINKTGILWYRGILWYIHLHISTIKHQLLECLVLWTGPNILQTAIPLTTITTACFLSECRKCTTFGPKVVHFPVRPYKLIQIKF